MADTATIADFERALAKLEHGSGPDGSSMMSSASYGLPADAPGGYAPEQINWTSKITTDGIYLHQLNTTLYEQDNGVDTSHGCLNLNYDNAYWYYHNSEIGDPVTVMNVHNGAPAGTLGQGNLWGIPWTIWRSHSALH